MQGKHVQLLRTQRKSIETGSGTSLTTPMPQSCCEARCCAWENDTGEHNHIPFLRSLPFVISGIMLQGPNFACSVPSTGTGSKHKPKAHVNPHLDAKLCHIAPACLGVEHQPVDLVSGPTKSRTGSPGFRVWGLGFIVPLK